MISPSALGLRSRSWFASALVLGIAALVRLPHYDVAWFGLDQVYFMAEGRRVLAGHFDVVGPLASGLNILGPLYSYLVAGLLWIREDPRFVVLFGVTCEIVASWLVFDIARRMFGTAAGAVAAISYITAPVLVISTRLIWNPTLLPSLVAFGWWLALRYSQSPSTVRLASVAIVAGLALTVHATGVFSIAGLGLTVLLARRPSLRQFAVALCAGVLPLVPVIIRLTSSVSDVAVLGTRIAAPIDALELARGIAQIVLALPKAFGDHWSIELSTLVLHLQAVLATAGVLIGVLRSNAFRAIWIGMAVSAVTNVASAFVYTSPISWHYFIALVPIACIGVAQACATLPRGRALAVAATTFLAASHLLFLDHFDRQAIRSGLIQVDAGRVGLRVPSVIGYAPTLGDLQKIGQTLRQIVPDGSTAMLMAHGARGELWREIGAEFLPPAEGPRSDWTTEFLLTGRGARPLTPNARVLDERVCAFERVPNLSWKALHVAPVAGWESPEFQDANWISLSLPRRITRPSLAGPFPPLATWRTPQLLLRGYLTSTNVGSRRALSIVIHGLGNSAHWIAGAFVNGRAIAVARDRVMNSSMSRNQEWLIDLTGQLHDGENLIALALDGQLPAFDLDIFEVPCLDDEWYH